MQGNTFLPCQPSCQLVQNDICNEVSWALLRLFSFLFSFLVHFVQKRCIAAYAFPIPHIQLFEQLIKIKGILNQVAIVMQSCSRNINEQKMFQLMEKKKGQNK